MKIAFLLPNLHPGGALEAASNIADRISATCDVSTYILGQCDNSERLQHHYQRLRVENGLDFSGRHLDWIQKRKAIRKLVQQLASDRIDIVHSHLWPAIEIGSIAARIAGVVHVAHVHDRSSWSSRTGWKGKWWRWHLRGCLKGTYFLAVSQAVVTSNTTLLRSRPCTIIGNGVDCESLGSIPDITWSGSLKIGVAARFAPEKGQAVLIRAVRFLRDSGIPVKLFLAGDGGQRSACEDLAKSLSLEEECLFLGHINDMVGFYTKIDVFCLPTTECEGMPLSVLEAQAAGRVVVGTRVPGTDEAIEHGVDGFLVEPNNPQQLALTLRQIWESRHSVLALASRARWRPVDWSVIADKVVEVYHRHSFG